MPIYMDNWNCSKTVLGIQLRIELIMSYVIKMLSIKRREVLEERYVEIQRSSKRNDEAGRSVRS